MAKRPIRIRCGAEEWTLITISAIVLIAGLFVKDLAGVVDEHHHVAQIEHYRHGSFAPDPGVATFPGYHLLLWGISAVFRLTTLNELRFLSCLLGLASVAVFYRCAVKIDPRVALVRTLEYFLLPILFPYFFLVYTDPCAMLFLLLAVSEYLDKRYVFAGIWAGLSVLVRQSCVFWVCLLLAMAYVDAYGFRLSKYALQEHLRRCWTFVLVIVGFSLFVLIAGQVAVASTQYHPLGIFRIENIIFSLLMVFLLFWPLLVPRLSEMYRLLKCHPWPFVAGFIMAGLCLWLFTVDHPYNVSSFFLRNRVLRLFTSNAALKAWLLLPVFLAILFLGVVSLRSQSQYLLYPFWLLSLLPFWLIETRYYIPPMALFLLFRQSESFVLERRLLMHWGGLSAIVFSNIVSRQAFP